MAAATAVSKRDFRIFGLLKREMSDGYTHAYPVIVCYLKAPEYLEKQVEESSGTLSNPSIHHSLKNLALIRPNP
jgi:hypothetical protein